MVAQTLCGWSTTDLSFAWAQCLVSEMLVNRILSLLERSEKANDEILKSMHEAIERHLPQTRLASRLLRDIPEALES